MFSFLSWSLVLRVMERRYGNGNDVDVDGLSLEDTFGYSLSALG